MTGFPPVGGRAARADALAGGGPVDGLVVEVGQAGRGPVAQAPAVGFGERDGDEHLPRCAVLDAAGHPVEDLGQGRLPGDLLEQGAVLDHPLLGVLDLGGLHLDHPDPDDVAVAALLVGEVEERLPRVRAGVEHHPHVAAGVGLTGAVDFVEQGDEILTGQFGHQLGQRDTGMHRRCSPMVAKNAGFAVSTTCTGPASEANTAMDCPNKTRRSSSAGCPATADSVARLLA